ncbi:Hypothetical predicted protein [Mytilus galloprovincialis]|uniref:Peptidase A2 domain-containing protein n=1 Tax=Mytilus galloprovincialis TaxID=29158 RepID=A0A8B6CNG3_MYTGA|nr:Hypothetical predicted protein [Mytilus galloprovincialis]
MPNMQTDGTFGKRMRSTSEGKLFPPGGHTARSPRRPSISASRIRSRSRSRVNKCMNVNKDFVVENSTLYTGENDVITSSEKYSGTDSSISSDSKFLYLTVRFDSLKVSALVDTGSSVNIISEQLYDSLPYSKKSDFNADVRESIVLANSQKIEVVGTAYVQMNISRANHRVFTYILKMSSHPIILGTNYLIANKMVIDFSEMSAVPKTSNVYLYKKDNDFTTYRDNYMGKSSVKYLLWKTRNLYVY